MMGLDRLSTGSDLYLTSCHTDMIKSIICSIICSVKTVVTLREIVLQALRILVSENS